MSGCFLKLSDVRARSYPHCDTGRRWGGGVLMEPLPRVLDMLQYFETILPSVESHWSSRKNEVYLMGDGAAGGL